MILRDLILFAVWARVINDLVQGVVHLITYVMLRRTQSTDRFSVALRQRELALGNKSLSGAGFDLLIAIAVTWLSNPEEPGAFDGAWFLSPIVTWTALSAILATIVTVRFMLAYQREHWGVRGREETKVERAARRTEQAAIEIRSTAEELRRKEIIRLEKVAEVIAKTALDVEGTATNVEEIRKDVGIVKSKIVEGEVP